MKQLFVALVAFCSATAPFAQSLERAYVLAEPLQYSKAGQFRGCGLNVKLLQETQSQSRDYVTFSINLWIDTPSSALLKTAWSKATVGSSSSLHPQKIESAWVRLGTGEPARPQRTMAGEDGAILAVMRAEAGLELMSAILLGKQELQIGFKPSGAKFERVFYGVPTVEAETGSRVQLCFEEMAEKLKASANSAPSR